MYANQRINGLQFTENNIFNIRVSFTFKSFELNCMNVLFQWGVYVSLLLHPGLLILCTLKIYFLKNKRKDISYRKRRKCKFKKEMLKKIPTVKSATFWDISFQMLFSLGMFLSRNLDLLPVSFKTSLILLLFLVD